MSTRKKILVTGGAGFIGSHTCVELVDAGYLPVIVDNFSNSETFIPDRISDLCGGKIKVYTVDCTDEKTFNEVFVKEKPDGVIHFAAYKAVGESVEQPSKYYHNNIGSLIVLLRLMEQHKVKNLVFSSSCTVYGQPEIVPVTEQSPDKNAMSPYGFTKIACEQLINDCVMAKKKLKSVSLRYFNPIGAHPSGKIGELPRGVPNNLVPYITQTAIGIREKLTVNGNDYSTTDGTCVRDYIHVVDLAKAHVAALKRLDQIASDSASEVYNIGTGNGNTILEVIQTFEKVSGMKLNYSVGPRRAGDVEKIWASTALAEKNLNWKTRLTLADALRDAWNWEQNLRKK